MLLSQIARKVAEDILVGTEFETIELLALTHDRDLRADEIDEIYELITEGGVVLL
jgi:hypothetical protein